MSRIAGHHAHHLLTTPAAVAIALLAGALTACGSSSPPQTPSIQIPSQWSSASTTYHNAPLQTGATTQASDSSIPESPAGLTFIGTFTSATAGANITTDVSIGTPMPNSQAQPPQDVLTACNWNYTSTIAQSVYIHGSLTIHYNGSIAETIAIAQPNLLNLTRSIGIGAGDEGPAGLQGPDGSWHACGTGNDWSYVLEPGSSTTVDMWIDYTVLSNAHPVFSSADQAPLAISVAAGGGGASPTSVSGPHAAKCTIDGDTTLVLLLYSTPPYSYTAVDVNGTSHIGSCVAA